MDRLTSYSASIALSCALATLAPAVTHAEERSTASLAQVAAVTDVRLDQVRAGTATPRMAPVTVGVVLWDEVRPPIPPVRNSPEPAGVTAQLNTFRK